ncbi:hypothetical protein B566_EDAN007597 [Ephemera danica]|nr:hypothetical protein B566_EDAN007597 [Ephemera danica]
MLQFLVTDCRTIVILILLFLQTIPSFCCPEEPKGRFLPGWFTGGGDQTRVTGRYLPATLQVLEHTASQVNGTWGDEATLQNGGRIIFEEMQPLPGLVRLTVLRNSLFAEARAAKLENFEGYTPDVEQKLIASSYSPLPEQIASIIEHTVHAGEFKELESTRAWALTNLADELIVELRDPKTDLSRALRQFAPLSYSKIVY